MTIITIRLINKLVIVTMKLTHKDITTSPQLILITDK